MGRHAGTHAPARAKGVNGGAQLTNLYPLQSVFAATVVMQSYAM